MKNNLKQLEVEFFRLIPLQAYFHPDVVQNEFISEIFKKRTGTEKNIVFGSVKSHFGHCGFLVSQGYGTIDGVFDSLDGQFAIEGLCVAIDFGFLGDFKGGHWILFHTEKVVGSEVPFKFCLSAPAEVFDGEGSHVYDKVSTGNDTVLKVDLSFFKAEVTEVGFSGELFSVPTDIALGRIGRQALGLTPAKGNEDKTDGQQ